MMMMTMTVGSVGHVILNFELDVAQGEEELGVVVVEDLVRDAGAEDAADDLDVGAYIGFRKVAGELAVERDGEQDLKEGSWNVVALEFDFVLVAALDGCCEDCVDGEQEEDMVTNGRSHFHGAEASGHSLEAVVGEEL